MDEDTTTPVAEDTGAEQAQPVDVAPAEAVEPTAVDTEEETPVAPAEGVSDEDTELTDWASKKGLELDSDNAKKAAKMAREAERAMHQKAQKASELEKTVTVQSDAEAEAVAEATGQDPELLKRLQRVEVRDNVRDFWNTPLPNGDMPDRSIEQAMIEQVTAKPYLAGDLRSLYATALFESGGVAAVKSQGKREALQSLAHKQQAAVPTGNATTTGTPKTKNFADLSIEEMEAKLGFARR